MNSKTVIVKSGLDNFKLVIAVLLVASGIVAFHYFETYSALLRVIGLLLVGSLAVVLVYQTAIGRQLWQFFLDSKMEVDKVVWPTQDETIQTTVIVVAMVLVMSILLWLFDALLVLIVQYLTGQGN